MVTESLQPSLTSFRSFFKIAFDCVSERILREFLGFGSQVLRLFDVL